MPCSMRTTSELIAALDAESASSPSGSRLPTRATAAPSSPSTSSASCSAELAAVREKWWARGREPREGTRAVRWITHTFPRSGGPPRAERRPSPSRRGRGLRRRRTHRRDRPSGCPAPTPADPRALRRAVLLARRQRDRAHRHPDHRPDRDGVAARRGRGRRVRDGAPGDRRHLRRRARRPVRLPRVEHRGGCRERTHRDRDPTAQRHGRPAVRRAARARLPRRTPRPARRHREDRPRARPRPPRADAARPRRRRAVRRAAHRHDGGRRRRRRARRTARPGAGARRRRGGIRRLGAARRVLRAARRRGGRRPGVGSG